MLCNTESYKCYYFNDVGGKFIMNGFVACAPLRFVWSVQAG